MSSLVTMKFLVESIRHEALNSMAFMLDQSTSTQLSDKLRYAIESCPDYAKTINDSVGRIVLNNKSQIIFKGGYSVNASRGVDSVLYSLVDEYNHQIRLQELLGTISPTQNLLGERARTIFCGTPEERSGYGYEMTRAIAGENLEEICHEVATGKLVCEEGIEGLYYIVKGKTCLVFTHFMAVPEYRKWGRQGYLDFRKEKDNTDWDTILKEYNLQYLDVSVSQVFDPQLINSCIEECEEDEPDSGARYYCGIDCSGVTDSDKADFHSLTMLKVKNGKYSISKYYYKRGNTASSRVGEMASIIIKFRCRKVAIETNSMGSTYLSQLRSLFVKQNYQCEFRPIHQTSERRLHLIGDISLKLEQGALKFSAENPVVIELKNLIRNNKNKILAASKHHDDAVFSLGLSLNYALDPDELLVEKKAEEREKTRSFKRII